MLLFFTKNGKLKKAVNNDEITQYDTDKELFVHFDGIDVNKFSATLTISNSDGVTSPLVMYAKEIIYNDEVYFGFNVELANIVEDDGGTLNYYSILNAYGRTTFKIDVYYDTALNKKFSTGNYTFIVRQALEEGEITISKTEYYSLIRALASKVNVESGTSNNQTLTNATINGGTINGEIDNKSIFTGGVFNQVDHNGGNITNVNLNMVDIGGRNYVTNPIEEYNIANKKYVDKSLADFFEVGFDGKIINKAVINSSTFKNGNINDVRINNPYVEEGILNNTTLENTRIDHIENDYNPVNKQYVDNELSYKLDKKPDGETNLIDENNKINNKYISDTILGQMTNGGIFYPQKVGATEDEVGIDYGTGIVVNLTRQAKDLLGVTDNNIVINKDDFERYNKFNFYFICGDNVEDINNSFYSMDLKVGDWLVTLANDWGKVDNTDAVQSVAGRTGHIVLTSDDISFENKTIKPLNIDDTTLNNPTLNNAKTYTTPTNNEDVVNKKTLDDGLNLKQDKIEFNANVEHTGSNGLTSIIADGIGYVIPSLILSISDIYDITGILIKKIELGSNKYRLPLSVEGVNTKLRNSTTPDSTAFNMTLIYIDTNGYMQETTIDSTNTFPSKVLYIRFNSFGESSTTGISGKLLEMATGKIIELTNATPDYLTENVALNTLYAVLGSELSWGVGE